MHAHDAVRLLLQVTAAMGVKIVAPGLESAVAGTSLHVIGPEDDEEELKDSVMEDMAVSHPCLGLRQQGYVMIVLWLRADVWIVFQWELALNVT
jgi:translation initiation factor IF-2